MTNHRPELHVTPEQGVLEAPAGVLLHEGVWHVFSQYRPSADAGCRWSHQSSSTSPYDWEVCDDVLAPYRDEVGVRAGSVIANGETVELVFTAVMADSTCIKIAYIPNAYETLQTVSDDQLWLDSHVDDVSVVLSDCDGYARFRSPCVVRDWRDDNRDDHEGWLMLVVTGSSESPDIVVAESADLHTWTLLGSLCFEGAPTGIEGCPRIVSPRILRLKDQQDDCIYDVLLVTVTINGIDVPGYLVGELDRNVFTVHTPFTLLDHGYDFSRPRYAYCSDKLPVESRYDSATVFGLMRGETTTDEAFSEPSYDTEGWAGCLSLPRTVTLQGGRIYQTPKPGLPAAISTSEAVQALSLVIEFDTPGADQCGEDDAAHDFATATSHSATSADDDGVTFSLIDGTGAVAATITFTRTELTFDRTINPAHPYSGVRSVERDDPGLGAVTVVVDGSTCEVFADGGSIAMASRVYFNEGFSRFSYRTVGSAHVSASLHIGPA